MTKVKEIRNSKLKYTGIPDDELLYDYEYFEKLFETEFKYPNDTEYYVNAYSLIDSIVRVDKRKAYFFCFHNMEISERKQVALYAYWFIKFKPFTLCDNRFVDDKYSASINELFAIYLISSILLFEDNVGFDTIDFTKSKDKYTYFDKLMYSLHYRCFSIDSFMLLVDSITPQTFEYEFDVQP